MYEDETDFKREKFKRGRLLRQKYSPVDKRVKIISGIFAIMGKEKREST